ncbi:hypothetical protein XBP1_390004 [Xenorhabdus bovienii str. puntauvense]|uniref:Uncharacterized protein n=1 Tax=Xenorhabdus bovienii str. puntauvense TaxID=1398201 RepID=A0A077N8Q3_XENBV|nr:hypothetical protein [Xenorhabdus bovienii]CDG98586.1 hypothetical protein XBP1_390004 [Xenorhabdus bovienii str. puntauvense]
MNTFTPAQFDDISMYIKDNSIYTPVRIFPVWTMINGCEAVRGDNQDEVIIFQNKVPVAMYILDDDEATVGIYQLKEKNR